MKKPINPFLITGYQGPEYFCDREAETETIISALNNGRNITLISPRRMGKTGLIKHVFHQLQAKDKNVSCFYLDIFSTQSLQEFVTMFGRSVLGKLDSFSQSTLKGLVSFFKSCRPVINVDEVTGMPSVTLDFVAERSEETLREICEYLVASKKECYIAIDEFQQILEYPEKGIEGLLRSYVQFMPNVHFIFSGSKKHLMEAMFFSINRPFYQSTQKLFLGAIAPEAYRDFAIRWCNKGHRELPDALFREIYQSMDGHTWYVQYLLNRLYALPYKKLDSGMLREMMTEILKENEYAFLTYYRMLTANQAQLLKAIAHKGTVAEINASSFIKQYNLKGASSVNTALKFLLEKELVLKEPEGYIVYDRFFAMWLKLL